MQKGERAYWERFGVCVVFFVVLTYSVIAYSQLLQPDFLGKSSKQLDR
jgi:hypothetical protein